MNNRAQPGFFHCTKLHNTLRLSQSNVQFRLKVSFITVSSLIGIVWFSVVAYNTDWGNITLQPSFGVQSTRWCWQGVNEESFVQCQVKQAMLNKLKKCFRIRKNKEFLCVHCDALRIIKTAALQLTSICLTTSHPMMDRNGDGINTFTFIRSFILSSHNATVWQSVPNDWHLQYHRRKNTPGPLRFDNIFRWGLESLPAKRKSLGLPFYGLFPSPAKDMVSFPQIRAE